jgi:hypothetical protein
MDQEEILREEIRRIILEIVDDTDSETPDIFQASFPSTNEKEGRLAKAKELAEKISQIDGVVGAYVDDWNKRGSFQIVVELDLDKDNMPKSPSFLMRVIKSRINKLGKQIIGFSPVIELPEMKYDRSQFMHQRNSYKLGYDRRYIMVDYEF